MDIFEYALAKEKKAEEFYRQLCENTGSKGLKTIFGYLADEESKHYQAIEKMRSSKSETYQSDILDRVQGVFTKKGRQDEFGESDSEELQIYCKGRELEKKSRDFYLQKAEQAQSEGVKNIFLQLAEEEKKHYMILDNIIDFVSRPQQWLENAEFFHLEEY